MNASYMPSSLVYMPLAELHGLIHSFVEPPLRMLIASAYLVVVIFILWVGNLQLDKLYPDHPILLLLGHEPRAVSFHFIQVLATLALAGCHGWVLQIKSRERKEGGE